MEQLGGNNNTNGAPGFHGYRKQLPRTNSYGPGQEINMGLPSPHTNPIPAPTLHGTTDDTECTVREQDRFMPIANVIRIMRKILPPHAKISDDAKETIQECVSEYISFITGEANDRCQREQRKTITAEDVLWAMSKLGFDDYIEPLTVYLHRYREFDGGERGSLRGEPLMKSGVENGSMAFSGFGPTAFHQMMAHQHGFFGVGQMNGFLNRQGNVGPSQASVACMEPFPAQGKEQL